MDRPSPPLPGLIAALLILVGAGLLTPATGAADDRVSLIRPFHHDGRLFVELWATDLLDERTASTIDSGLPGTCVYQIQLIDGERRVRAERVVDLSLRLDLWENVYVLDGPAGRSLHAALAAADSAWSHLPGVDLCDLGRLGPGESYRVRARTFVQPLAPEMRERLSRYVSGSSGRDREELALDLGAVIGQLLGRGGGGDSQPWSVGAAFLRPELEARP